MVNPGGSHAYRPDESLLNSLPKATYQGHHAALGLGLCLDIINMMNIRRMIPGIIRLTNLSFGSEINRILD